MLRYQTTALYDPPAESIFPILADFSRMEQWNPNVSSSTIISGEPLQPGTESQIGDIGSIMIAILVAVLFTILLVAGNTMAQSIRERTSELAVLKTLGFSNARVVLLVLAESCAIAGVGGAIGLALGWLITQQGDPTNGMLPAFFLPTRDLVLGAGLVAVLGLTTGLLPAVQAMRLKIVDALRKV